jgi:eukaryotic-like serine/threonine-protein kinase
MSLARAHDKLVGRTFGEFVLRERIGEGGFGAVYRAKQPALDREAVVKVLHSRLHASKTATERFLREAKLASKLDHPYAAHIYAFGAEPDGELWIAMEIGSARSCTARTSAASSTAISSQATSW